MKKHSRFFAVLLTLTLVLSLFAFAPPGVYAEEGDDACLPGVVSEEEDGSNEFLPDDAIDQEDSDDGSGDVIAFEGEEEISAFAVAYTYDVSNQNDINSRINHNYGTAVALTLNLTGNIDYNGRMTISNQYIQSCVFKLNGYRLTIYGDSYGLYVSSGASVSYSFPGAEGQLNAFGNEWSVYAINGSHVEVSYAGNTSWEDIGGVYANNASTVIVEKNVTWKSRHTAFADYPRKGILSRGGSEVYVGGDVNGGHTGVQPMPVYNVSVESGGKVEIAGSISDSSTTRAYIKVDGTDGTNGTILNPGDWTYTESGKAVFRGTVNTQNMVTVGSGWTGIGIFTSGTTPSMQFKTFPDAVKYTPSGNTIRNNTTTTQSVSLGANLEISGKSLSYNPAGYATTLNFSNNAGMKIQNGSFTVSGAGAFIVNSGGRAVMTGTNGKASFTTSNCSVSGAIEATGTGAEITVSGNVTAAQGNSYAAASAGSGGKITVTGNVTHNGMAGGGNNAPGGVTCSGGSVIVGGNITANGGCCVTCSSGGTVQVGGQMTTSLPSGYIILFQKTGISRTSASWDFAEEIQTAPYEYRRVYSGKTDGIVKTGGAAADISGSVCRARDLTAPSTTYRYFTKLDYGLDAIISGDELELLAAVNYTGDGSIANSGIVIDNKEVRLDLHGYKLTIDIATGGSVGLTVKGAYGMLAINDRTATTNVVSIKGARTGILAENGGRLLTGTTGSGIVRVAAEGGAYGVYAAGGGKATVFSSRAGGDEGCGVYASGGGTEVTVQENIAADGERNGTFNGTGVRAENQSRVVVAGDVLYGAVGVSLVNSGSGNANVILYGHIKPIPLYWPVYPTFWPGRSADDGKDNIDGIAIKNENGGTVTVNITPAGTPYLAGYKYGIYATGAGAKVNASMIDELGYMYYCGVYAANGATVSLGSVLGQDVIPLLETYGVLADGGHVNIGGIDINTDSNYDSKTCYAAVKNGGTITVTGGMVYYTGNPSTMIKVGNVAKTLQDYTEPTTKTGFYTFRNPASPNDGTIWTSDGGIVPVVDITGLPTAATAGTPLTLTGTVEPASATNQDIVWNVWNPGTTGANIINDVLYTATPGTVEVRATIKDGSLPGVQFAKTFNIAVSATSVIQVTDITGVAAEATVGTPLSLAGTVVPEGATDKNIIWSVWDAGVTGAAIHGNVFSAAGAGTASVRATVANGSGIGVPFTKNFSILVHPDPMAFVPAYDITAVPEEATAGVPLTLSGTVVPANATNKVIEWSIEDAGATGAVLSGKVLTAAASGTVEVMAAIADGRAQGVPYTQSFFIIVKNPPATLLTLSPTHAFLKDTVGEAKFTAALTPDKAENYTKIEWGVAGLIEGSAPYEWCEPVPAVNPDDPPVAGAPVLSLTPSTDGRTAIVKAIAPLKERTVQITAIYNGEFKATATMEILPDPAASVLNTEIILLEKAAVVNKAKDVGALVPVHITNQPPENFGFQTFELAPFAYSEPPLLTGSVVVDSVALYTQNSKTKAWDVPASGYSARMYGYDNRYIAIDADDTAKNTTVKVGITPAGGAEKDAGMLKLTVTLKYPKITLKAGSLNLAFPTQKASLTAVSSDGACTIVSVNPPVNSITWNGNEFELGARTAAGKVKATVEVEVGGYKKPYKNAPAVNVNVTGVLPKVKLSQASVKLLPDSVSGEAAKIQLVTADKKIPYESGYRIDTVTADVPNSKYKSDITVSYTKATGVINLTPNPGCVSGKALIKVTFDGSDKTLTLPLNVTVVKQGSVKPAAKVTSAKMNTGHETAAKIVDIPIMFEAANLTLGDWKVISVNGAAFDGSALAGAISVVPGKNQVTLTVKDRAALTGLLGANGADKKHTMSIGSNSLFDTKNGKTVYRTFSFTLTVSGKDQAGSVSVKGKIDIANPDSAVISTVNLSNTTSEIDTVELLNPAGTQSGDFTAYITGGKTFTIKTAHKQVVPGVQYKLNARVTLKNGFSFEKALTLKPIQTKSKAVQTVKAVTLHTRTPLTGQTVGVDLKTPANVKLGAVRLNEPALKKLKLVDADTNLANDGFKLEKNGANNWTVYFNAAKAPKALDKKGNAVKLGKSYTLKIELWADGTYEFDGNGKPVALGVTDSKGKFNAKSKPTIINVKVNIK